MSFIRLCILSLKQSYHIISYLFFETITTLYCSLFIKKLNKENIKDEQLPVDPDYYFRPWKIYSDIDRIIKSRRDNKDEPNWKEKLKEYDAILTRLANELHCKQSISCNKTLLLWSTTHIKCLLACERDWKPPNASASMLRNNLHKLISADLEQPIRDLSCWVWEQRFTRSGFQVDLGGWMFLTLIQVCIYYTFTIYMTYVGIGKS